MKSALSASIHTGILSMNNYLLNTDIILNFYAKEHYYLLDSI